MKFGNLGRPVFSLVMAACLSVSPMVFAEEYFDVDLAPGTPLIEAIRSIGYRAGRSVVINGDLGGTVTLSLEHTNFMAALNLLALSHGFTYKDVNGVIVVSTSTALTDIKTFKLNYLDPEMASKEMGLIFKKDQVMVNTDTNTVTVNGSSGQIEKAKLQLSNLDVAQPQISVKATVIELTHGKARELGLSFTSDKWSKNTAASGLDGVSFSITGAHEDTISNGNILARPSVTVFNGRKAHILMGDKVPVFTSSTTSTSTTADTNVSVEYKDVGVQLDVTPRINDRKNETITMNIKPSISTITKWVESGNNKAPQISTREAETILRVKSGQTILLGGLLKDEELKTIKEVPLLSKLPFFGELFKMRSNSKVKTEIVIAITPTILYDSQGAPFVESQKINPDLHEKLNELQREKVKANVGPEVSDEIDEENAELNKRLKASEAETQQLRQQLALSKAGHEATSDASVKSRHGNSNQITKPAAAPALKEAGVSDTAKQIKVLPAPPAPSKEELQVAADLKAWNEKLKMMD